MEPAPRRIDGYLPTEDHGSIDWLCLPRFDGPAVFSALLDHERGGSFSVTVDRLRESAQRYVDDTAVLVTTLVGTEGAVELTDLVDLQAGADLSADVRASARYLVAGVGVAHHLRRPGAGRRAAQRPDRHAPRPRGQQRDRRRPTSSLPEHLGGVRNWDDRYCWVRDGAFSVYALRRTGPVHQAQSFLAWVLAAIEQDRRTHLMYDVAGEVSLAERTDPGLEGYRRSAPGRWGNAASERVQHDVYGELLDCAHMGVRGGGDVGGRRWAKLSWLAAQAAEHWRTPDHGIWEVRSDSDQPFTYSVAMCQVALGRTARIARLTDGLGAEVEAWATRAARVREVLLREAWDERSATLTQRFGDGGTVDASLLALTLRRVLSFDHPRMAATATAVTERLGAGGGLIHRYDPAVSDDGLPGTAGAFLLCSFWWVDNLVGQGCVDEAGELYESLCARASPLGLLPEEIDPTTGAFLGNYLQAFSRIGVIFSGISLARAIGGA